MAELADATVSNTVGETHPGSSPGSGTDRVEEQFSTRFLFLLPCNSFAYSWVNSNILFRWNLVERISPEFA